jgi:hypothetical protein
MLRNHAVAAPHMRRLSQRARGDACGMQWRAADSFTYYVRARGGIVKLGLLRSLPSLGATRKPPHLCAYSTQPPVRLHERAKRARADSMLARPPIPRNFVSTIVARSHLHPAIYGRGSEVATSSCKEAVPASGQTYRRELTSPDMTYRAWPVGTGRNPGSFKRFKTSSDATTCWQ